MKRREVEKAKAGVVSMLRRAGIVLARGEQVEITDFGKNDYKKVGLGLVNRLNEPEYGSQWLTVLPGQLCPNHHHKFIKETFFIVKGDVQMRVNNEVIDMKAGDKLTMSAGTWHSFTSKGGAVIEEITTQQVDGDDHFEDTEIQRYIHIDNE